MHTLLPPFPSMLLCPSDPPSVSTLCTCVLTCLFPQLTPSLPSHYTETQPGLRFRPNPTSPALRKSFPDFLPICDHLLLQTPQVFVQIPRLVFVIICLLNCYLPIYSFTLHLFNISQHFFEHVMHTRHSARLWKLKGQTEN